MGKTPGKWIKTLLLGKKSPKSNLAVSVKDGFSKLSLDPPPVPPSSQPDTAAASTAQNVVVAPSNGDDLEPKPMNGVDELKLEQAASKIQAVFRARQARRAIRTLKGIIRLQAVIRGHLVRRQAVATYSCIWGIVKFQSLVRGRIARSSSSSSHNLIQPQKPHTEVNDSEALQVSTYRWMDNPTKFIIVDKLLASSPTALPLKIQYGPEEPNSAKVWLERWTQLHVWFPRPRAVKPKTKTKKRNYQAVVDSEKARPAKQGIKKQSGPTSGKVSNRSTAESEKLKRTVRKASALSKDPLRSESDNKAKHKSRKSRSASKEEVKEEKPRPSLKRSSLSNTSLKVTNRKSAEKKKDTVQIEPEVKVSDIVEVREDVESAEKEKDTADSVLIAPEVNGLDVLEGGGDAVESATKEKDTEDSTQIKPQVRVSAVLEEGDAVESAEKEKDTADSVQSVQIEPEMKVSDDLQGGGHGAESAEKEKDTTDVVPTELDVEEKENSQEEEEEIRASETNDKGEDLKCSDVKVSSDNGYTASDNSKPSERRVSSLHANDEGRTHSGRKVPSYMAPTASTLRRHSLPSPANGKPGTTTTMSPRAHKLLLASAKASMNGDRSVSSSKNKTDKSNKTEWKR